MIPSTASTGAARHALGALLAILAGVGAATGAATATLAAEDLTVVTWGGVYAESQQRAYGAPWEAATGNDVAWVNYNGGLAEIRAQVTAGAVTWDVVDVFAHEARRGCREGLFEPLPDDLVAPAPDGTPAHRDLVVDRPNDCVAPNIIWSWVVFGGAEPFETGAVTSIAHFFDVEALPGKRGLAAFPQATLEMALVADGVPPDEVYAVLDTPAGIDRAFAKLDAIAGHVVFWSSGEEALDLVASGEVVLSTGYNGRVSEAILTGTDAFRILWDGQVLEEEWFAVVKGAPNRAAAFDFLRHATTARAQAAQARWIPYGPMRRSALAIIAANEPWFHNGRDVMPHMPDRQEVLHRTVVADPDWWSAHADRIAPRYAAWMAAAEAGD